MNKIGVIGLGHVFKYQWQALLDFSEFNITSLCDTKINSMDLSFLNSNKVELYDNYKDMLKSDCDSVLLSVPMPLHYQVAKDAINSGKNVLLEKPAVLDCDELAELYFLAKEKDVLFHVAYHASFAKDLIWFLDKKDILRSEHGRIVGIAQKFFDPYMAPELMMDKVYALGDSWIDSGINALSVADRIIPLSTAKQVKTVFLKNNSVVTKMESTYVANDVDNSAVFLRVHTDWTLGLNFKMTEVFYEDGSVIELNHSQQSAYLYNGDKKTVLFSFNDEERLVTHYKGVFNDFINAINSKKHNEAKTHVLHNLLISTMNSYQ